MLAVQSVVRFLFGHFHLILNFILSLLLLSCLDDATGIAWSPTLCDPVQGIVLEDGELCSSACLLDKHACGSEAQAERCGSLSIFFAHASHCPEAYPDCAEQFCMRRCPLGQQRCDLNCVQVESNLEHCGGCHRRCEGDQVCVEGQCRCPEGLTWCGGQCVNIENHPEHCGQCQEACPSQQLCISGQCRCPEGLTWCDGQCVNLALDKDHCGQCQQRCLEGQVCVDGQCRCPSMQALCENRCVDLDNNPDHCGACHKACDRHFRCQGGQCQCGDNMSLCDGLCVDLTKNPKHCGSCHRDCSKLGNAICYQSSCEKKCPAGLTLCGQDCVDIKRDLQHCGACHKACTRPPNYQPVSCEDGRCFFKQCQASYADCDQDLDNGCELYLSKHYELSCLNNQACVNQRIGYSERRYYDEACYDLATQNYCYFPGQAKGLFESSRTPSQHSIVEIRDSYRHINSFQRYMPTMSRTKDKQCICQQNYANQDGDWSNGCELYFRGFRDSRPSIDIPGRGPKNTTSHRFVLPESCQGCGEQQFCLVLYTFRQNFSRPQKQLICLPRPSQQSYLSPLCIPKFALFYVIFKVPNQAHAYELLVCPKVPLPGSSCQALLQECAKSMKP